MSIKHYITPNWPAPKNIHAYTTTRVQGVSKPPYDNFNISADFGDDSTLVAANLQKLKNDLQLPDLPNWPKQVHGIEAICAEEAVSTSRPIADAVFSRQPHTVCAVKTADCLPLLICNKQGTEVAAVHAGWRGLAAGVIEATIQKLLSPRDQLLVWLGPAISAAHFEVGDEVYERFIAVDPQAASAFAQHKPNHWMADLYQLARQRLKHCSVTQIYGGEYCTYRDQQLFYSYRRDKGKTGHLASLIWFD